MASYSTGTVKVVNASAYVRSDSITAPAHADRLCDSLVSKFLLFRDTIPPPPPKDDKK